MRTTLAGRAILPFGFTLTLQHSGLDPYCHYGFRLHWAFDFLDFVIPGKPGEASGGGRVWREEQSVGALNLLFQAQYDSG